MGASKLADVERPRLGDALHKHPLIPPMHAVDPSDNLPRPISTLSMQDTLAPALLPETFVCMGDDSVFVVRDEWGDVVLEVAPNKVRFNQREGQYQASAQLLSSQERATLEQSTTWRHPSWLVVEPRRPQCHHYKRVMTAFEGDRERRHVERVCSAQRGESGEFVSLNDEQVFACEHRLPRDFVSEERLRVFDARRVAEARRSEEEWNPDEPPTRSLRPKGETPHGND